ncbi:FtsX-like permease family protein [Streptomyces sp. NPDC050504]|uniref:ABC transporter permease n=1 Tax=Streptomyces sp. NPDC050504 TaxID=3365618 RepID=UPI0037988D1A
MTGFVFLRARAHRLLLAAAVLAVLLTTAVLAALTAFSGSIGDAALRHTLTHRAAAEATLVVGAHLSDPELAARAKKDVAEKAPRAFDGLPVALREFAVSGPYALPRGLQRTDAKDGTEPGTKPGARSGTDKKGEKAGDPDLTHFAAVDRSRVRLTSGTWPKKPTGDTVEVALPRAAAQRLALKPGAAFPLTDRVGGPNATVKVRLTGIYEPVDRTDPYWQLDDLGGRGMRSLTFTTYGPLLTDPSVLDARRVTDGSRSWIATADFRTLTTDRIDSLRAAAKSTAAALTSTKDYQGAVTARTELPNVLDQAERALLVSRSTLTIVAVQLVLLAAYALLLVARLLSTERAGETDLLRARGGSRGRITALAAIEALLIAAPAALGAPLLAGPLTELLADRGGLTDLGLRIGGGDTATVWLVAVGTALGCALAVVAPALTATSARAGRTATLPGPVRAGADIALLAIAGVAYWQLDRQTGDFGGGALSGDRSGSLGIDPLLVAAPALALLAGTVLTLRLLPPAAKLAERRAAGGRGLPAALAGWQFSRRPLRGAGPVLLLVLAVAMGMLAIGQAASWDRSQQDQADFASGADIRVTGGHIGDIAHAGEFTAVPGVRAAAPAYRTTEELSGNRQTTLLAVDTANAADGLLLRDDLSDDTARDVLAAVAPAEAPRAGLRIPEKTRQLGIDLRIAVQGAPRGVSPSRAEPLVTVALEDRYGIPYRVLLGPVPADGRRHTFPLDVGPQGGLALTGFEVDQLEPVGTAERQQLTIEAIRAVGTDGAVRPVPLTSAATGTWRGEQSTSRGDDVAPLTTVGTGSTPLSVSYDTGNAPDPNEFEWVEPATVNVVVKAQRPKTPTVLKAVATDTYLKAAGAKVGQRITVTLNGESVNATLVKSVRHLPTTGPAAGGPPPDSTGEAAKRDGGALLFDLRALNQLFARSDTAGLFPGEWWLSAAPGKSAEAAAAVLARPDQEPSQVHVRDRAAEALTSDPLGAGPRSALLAVAVVAAALAAVGFGVSAVGSRRERGAEFAVLRAIGAPGRQLARMIAAEQTVLIAIGSLVGLAIGAVLTRAVVPLIVLTGQATKPVPEVLVELPVGQVALLIAGVTLAPLLIVAAIALRRTDPVVTLRQGSN